MRSSAYMGFAFFSLPGSIVVTSYRLHFFFLFSCSHALWVQSVSVWQFMIIKNDHRSTCLAVNCWFLCVSGVLTVPTGKMKSTNWSPAIPPNWQRATAQEWVNNTLFSQALLTERTQTHHGALRQVKQTHFLCLSGDTEPEHQLWCEQTEEGAHRSAGMQKQVEICEWLLSISIEFIPFQLNSL